MFTSGPGQTYTVSVFVNPIIEDLGWSRTSVSGLYTAGSLTAAAARFLVGRLLDQYGARVVLPAVVVLFGFALIFIGQVSQQWHLYAGFALIRVLGQGSLTLIPTTLIAVWFVRLRGRVMALNSLGAVASQARVPPSDTSAHISLRLAQRLGRTGVDRLAADANAGDPVDSQKPRSP